MFGLGLGGIGGIIGGLVSTVAAVGQSISQANAANAQIEQQNAIARYNAQVAQNNQIANNQMRQLEMSKLRRQQASDLSETRANFSASGFTFQGTPTAVLTADIQQMGEDQNLLNYQYDVRGTQYKNDEVFQLASQQSKVKPNFFGPMIGGLGNIIGSTGTNIGNFG